MAIPECAVTRVVRQTLDRCGNMPFECKVQAIYHALHAAAFEQTTSQMTLAMRAAAAQVKRLLPEYYAFTGEQPNKCDNPTCSCNGPR